MLAHVKKLIAAIIGLGILFVIVTGSLKDCVDFVREAFSSTYGILLLVLIAVAIAIYEVVRRGRKQLPDAAIVFEGDGPSGLWLGTQCDPQYVAQAHRIAKTVFVKQSVPRWVIDSWRRRNNCVLICLHEASGKVVGYFDVLPLRSECVERFVLGALRERDIRGQHLFAPDHAPECLDLYLAGMAVAPTSDYKFDLYAVTLICGLLQYLEEFYPTPPDRHIYALGASREGRAMLQRFGFGVVTGHEQRRDHTDLYGLLITPESLAAARN